MTIVKLWNYTREGVVHSSPEIADGTLYFGSLSGKVYAIGFSPDFPQASITGLTNFMYPSD